MNNPQAQEVTQYIEKLPVKELVADNQVSSKFIQLYNAIHGEKMGESIYQKEQFNFMKLLDEKPDLQECTKLSLYGCFLDVAVNGLSLDTISKPHCYIIPRSVKSGRKNEHGYDIYEKRASIQITGHGELMMRKRAGHINYADDPVIVYHGDYFQPALDAQGKKRIDYKPSVPRKSKKVMAAFIRIVRNDGSVDYHWLLEDDFERLAGFSAKSKSYYDKKSGKRVMGKANELYSSHDGGIDPGFAENKMIKHAFDAYPKIKVGEFTQLETQQELEPVINYDIDTEKAKANDISVEEANLIPEDENFVDTITENKSDDSVTVDDENF